MHKQKQKIEFHSFSSFVIVINKRHPHNFCDIPLLKPKANPVIWALDALQNPSNECFGLSFSYI